MPLRTVVVGCGAIARQHLPAIRAAADARLVGVFDQNRARAEQAIEGHADERVYASWKDVLNDPEVDCVDLLLPHYLHQRFAVEAAEAGKHVVVEKPIATSLAEADAMIAAAARHRVALMVCHTVLFEPGARAVTSLIRSGSIGEVYLAQTIGLEGPSTVSVRPWLADDPGGGVLMAQAIHQIYFLQDLLGPVARVSGMKGRRKVVAMANDETCLALLEFTNGAVAEITSTFGQTVGPYTRGTFFYGSEGYVAYQPHFRPGAPRPEIEVVSEKAYHDREAHQVTFQPENQFAVMWRELASALVAGRGALVPGEAGRAAIEVVLAAYRSADEGRVIELPLA
ncbi:MAG TPA: Gfo/Idh/MocA family oxidoreductase [Chloroflexota bacterium]|nr:Gfo/Idh/MocA family oxidoreductase [Chloroflexota bacterium]